MWSPYRRQQSLDDTMDDSQSLKQPDPCLANDDALDGFGDLESVLNSFSIDSKQKPRKRRKTLGMSMKFWKTKDDQQ